MSGHAGGVLDGGTPTSRRSSRTSPAYAAVSVAVASPAIIRKPGGMACTVATSCAGSRSSLRWARRRCRRRRASASSTRRSRRTADTSSGRREASRRVENAFVVWLPTKLWSCDAPGVFGNTIGSSVLRWLNMQLPMKFTRCSCLTTVGRTFASSVPAPRCATAVAATAVTPRCQRCRERDPHPERQSPRTHLPSPFVACHARQTRRRVA